MSTMHGPGLAEKDYHETEVARLNVSHALTSEMDSSRYVVAKEYERVTELLNERYVPADAHRSRLVKLGHWLGAKAGLYKPKPDVPVARPWLQARQERKQELIRSELESSRQFLRGQILWGVDDVAVDERLGLREEVSILPPLFQQLHQKTEKELGREISFLDWMTNYATDDQLINVWQWHDDYIRRHEEDPRFKERVARIKASYKEGLAKAIEAGDLHEDMAAYIEEVDGKDIKHGSPFSPILSHAAAFAEGSTIQVRPWVADYDLYHELTHFAGGGFVDLFDEGAIDLIAMAIYNHSHPASEQMSRQDLVYKDGVAALEALERITEGSVDLRELSYLAAGGQKSINTVGLIVKVDAPLGAPFLTALVIRSQTLMKSKIGEVNGGTLRHASHMLLRRGLDALASVVLDADGKLVVRSIEDFVSRVLSDEFRNTHSQDEVADALGIAAEAHALIEEAKSKN